MNVLRLVLTVFCLFPVHAGIALADDDYAAARQQMVDHINEVVLKTAKYTDRTAFDPRVMKVMGETPRHLFVPEDQLENAYTNRPLPIGYGQTISEPYIVALMTELLRPQPDHKVLEIGTGSGYQAAVLSPLVKHVYSIEIIDELGNKTRRLLDKLGYANIDTRIADGYNGWPEHAPFDGIVVTAAISHIPPPLVQQLKNGGVMVIPVGTRFQTQQLTLVNKDMQGRVTTKQILPVRFVAFTGGH
jgi:protein-L-isoaspartate(D-aspartate) O-methyltransferase